MMPLHVKNPLLRENITVPVDNQAQATVVGAKVGEGYVVHAGDVNPGEESDRVILSLCGLSVSTLRIHKKPVNGSKASLLALDRGQVRIYVAVVAGLQNDCNDTRSSPFLLFWPHITLKSPTEGYERHIFQTITAEIRDTVGRYKWSTSLENSIFLDA